ncbi:MAG: exopolyphosphatase [Methylobacillus sp.]|jgi:exopolyphosphatase/guanosine-5'-triphosphate,3'-diphosphate pyrophosphatase|nr:exopolyphosphatase [Methylobacillus sp.]
MKKTMPAEIAAVDLGSNSFRLQMAQLVDDQLVFHDSLREMVRLGAGLGKDKTLDADSQYRAIDCLKRFGERLRGLPQDAVRAVATNTFRVAKNAPQLLKEAEAALGFPIEIIAGREEARMIFVGVTHGLSASHHERLVIDIGGGSTEFIIGRGFEPEEMESLYMGCVSYSMKYFADGKLSEGNLKRAEIAVREEVQGIHRQFGAGNWNEAVGSSGTARALGEVLLEQGWSNGEITLEGLENLRDFLVKTKDLKKLQLAGVNAERLPSFPGGFCIMLGAFRELGIQSMEVANGALREGVLYELVGRMHQQDTREETVARFKRRYHVDARQARRVEATALALLKQVEPRMEHAEAAERHLSWAARLHEIGTSIAHVGYHKHSSYILEHADMPGFSRMEQQTLSLLVRCQRRSLPKAMLPEIIDERSVMIAALRLAALLHRNRQDISLPELEFDWNGKNFRLRVDEKWLAQNPLAESALHAEVSYWEDAGVEFKLK